MFLKLLLLGQPLVFQQPTLIGQCVIMALGFKIGNVGERGGCKQNVCVWVWEGGGGGGEWGRRTPVYHTHVDGWSPREMLWKRGTLLEVIQVGRRLGRALQLPLSWHNYSYSYFPSG